jgi:hypothetical protein
VNTVSCVEISRRAAVFFGKLGPGFRRPTWASEANTAARRLMMRILAHFARFAQAITRFADGELNWERRTKLGRMGFK